jgi:hypothetical protein
MKTLSRFVMATSFLIYAAFRSARDAMLGRAALAIRSSSRRTDHTGRRGAAKASYADDTDLDEAADCGPPGFRVRRAALCRAGHGVAGRGEVSRLSHSLLENYRRAARYRWLAVEPDPSEPE